MAAIFFRDIPEADISNIRRTVAASARFITIVLPTPSSASTVSYIRKCDLPHDALSVRELAKKTHRGFAFCEGSDFGELARSTNKTVEAGE